MNLLEHIAHLLAISFVIAVVYTAIKKDSAAAIAAGAARFFFLVLLVISGVSALLYILTLL